MTHFEVLAVIGTSKSTKALINAGNLYRQDQEFGRAALTAIQAIKARGT